ncbi:MAG: 7-carboxy-7-deazaguanine synthase QueE [Bacteroidales bacterium]|nr:7-carboxy-7-deazaguanine synthase QueE [Bacteroidales bacterium]
MNINLSREGVFPLVDDSGMASTGWTFPGTIQGEGKLCGVPSIFVRTQGCNLRCSWKNSMGETVPCDTAHTWSENGGYTVDAKKLADSIYQHCSSSNIRHIVVTGGEPMLQSEGTEELLKYLQKWYGLHTTLETNSTIFNSQIMYSTVLLSISPKLGMVNMSDKEYAEIVAENINHLHMNMRRMVQLKFVVSQLSDDERIRSFVEMVDERSQTFCSRFHPTEDVLVMPMGATREELSLNAPIAAELAVKNGWRYTPRLHVDLWNNKERT